MGVLVKQSILNQYDVATVTDKYEGILWLQFINKTSRKQIGICVCYLPPAGSSRGDQSQEFFDTLKALLIDNYHLGPFLLCGDLNARCGTLEDVPDSDKIPTRIPIDKVSNQRGKELVEILHTLELCILNGRFDRTKDNFTSVSTRGVAVVDYYITPNTALEQFENFQVHDILDIINSKNILIDSTIPDHRLLTVEIKQSFTPPKSVSCNQPVTIKKIPPGFMQDEEVIEDLGALAAQFSLDTSHIDINQVYDSFCKIIDEQLETMVVKNPKGSQNFHKAWWNEELSTLAKKVRCALKAWERNKSNGELKLAYLNLQRNFSKLVRKCKRQFRRERQMNFWNNKRISPKISGISLRESGGIVINYLCLYKQQMARW